MSQCSFGGTRIPLVESLSSTSASAPSQEHAAASAASASRLCLFSVAEDAVDVAGDVADVVDVDICSLSVVGSAVLSIVGGDAEVDVDADLHELGIDSLGLAELMGLLEDPAATSEAFYKAQERHRACAPDLLRKLSVQNLT